MNWEHKFEIETGAFFKGIGFLIGPRGPGSVGSARRGGLVQRVQRGRPMEMVNDEIVNGK
jgi:hypothetical protein